MPVYNPGKEYVLFLNEDSKLGLTSPLGLFQGSFKVMQNQKGERVVMNSLSNKGLFKNVQIGNNAALKMAKKKQEAEGAIELNAFFDMIKTLNK